MYSVPKCIRITSLLRLSVVPFVFKRNASPRMTSETLHGVAPGWLPRLVWAAQSPSSPLWARHVEGFIGLSEHWTVSYVFWMYCLFRLTSCPTLLLLLLRKLLWHCLPPRRSFKWLCWVHIVQWMGLHLKPVPMDSSPWPEDLEWGSLEITVRLVQGRSQLCELDEPIETELSWRPGLPCPSGI